MFLAWGVCDVEELLSLNMSGCCTWTYAYRSQYIRSRVWAQMVWRYSTLQWNGGVV